MNQEIELKFAMKEIPNFKNERIQIYQITQTYLYKDQYSSIRKRKIGDVKNKKEKYVYTVKTKGDIQSNHAVYEIESEITKEEYESLKSKKNHVVEKRRIKIPIENGLVAELDIYYGHLEGLITVEVEFSSEEKIAKFIKPGWFGAEISKKEFSNSKLSKMTREEFLEKIDQKVLEENMKMKCQIEEILKQLISEGKNEDG